ncbi:reverse transcriptase [Phytophthora megakarya]|uniref:Reverse transcriptase n=1 Tax=Phytophthora megakarya TaxID=4795 RepID=A0A225UFV6_9STRA|nr:reverse transcriptase [Phytophthora megakarya]
MESAWEVVKARSGYLESLTVNEAEYNGLILGLDMLEGLDRRRLVICGDSNLVIRQLVHVKRDWNGSADSLASAALQRQRGIEVLETSGYQDLATLNRLDEILIPKTKNPVSLIREIRVDRIKQAQEEEVWIAGMKKYLSGSIADLTQAEARSYGKIAADYEASSSRSAQTVAESYEECVFRRFGASGMIRHDREPGFMSDFFRAFNKILGQRQ